MHKTFITLGPGVIIIKLSVVNLSTLSVSCAVLSLQTSFLSALWNDLAYRNSELI